MGWDGMGGGRRNTTQRDATIVVLRIYSWFEGSKLA